jgi:peptide/nickel transport system permease protein
VIRFLIRRVAASLVGLCGVALLTFSVLRLVPGDPVDGLLGEQATPAQRQEMRRFLGLDRPLHRQLAAYLGDLAGGTMGRSYRHRDATVASRLIAVFPYTLELAAAAMCVGLGIALPLGILAALRAGTALDAAATGAALTGVAVDKLWLGPLLIFLFYVRLGWLPGPGDDPAAAGALVLPAITMGAALAAMLSRITRASLLEVVREEFVTCARAKGLPERTVIVRHALRNALIPVMHVAGLQFGALLGGAMITEKIFARPGVGTLMLDAVSERDYPVVQGCVLAIATCYLIVNLVTDLATAAVDPRVRLR